MYCKSCKTLANRTSPRPSIISHRNPASSRSHNYLDYIMYSVRYQPTSSTVMNHHQTVILPQTNPAQSASQPPLPNFCQLFRLETLTLSLQTPHPPTSYPNPKPACQPDGPAVAFQAEPPLVPNRLLQKPACSIRLFSARRVTLNYFLQASHEDATRCYRKAKAGTKILRCFGERDGASPLPASIACRPSS
jgi:hypothetical protein